MTNSINSSFPSSSAHIVSISDNMPNHRNESMIDSNGVAILKTAALMLLVHVSMKSVI